MKIHSKFFGAVFFTACLASSWPAFGGTPADAPKAKSECLAAGGEWRKHPIGRDEECLLPTKDGGKVCRTSDDCQSLCMETSDGKRSCEPFVGKRKCIELTPHGTARTTCVN